MLNMEGMFGVHPVFCREFESWLNKYNEEHCRNIKILTYGLEGDGIKIVVSEYDDVVEAEIEKLNDFYLAYKMAEIDQDGISICSDVVSLN